MKKSIAFLLLLPILSYSQIVNVRLYDGVDSFYNPYWNNWKIPTSGGNVIASGMFTDLFGNKTTIHANLSLSNQTYDNGYPYPEGAGFTNVTNPVVPDTVL